MSVVKSWAYTFAGFPETLQFQDTVVPAEPGPRHVLVQVKAGAVNPVDIQLMNIPMNSLPGLNKPKVAGRDFAGIILAAAPGTGFKKGDEVMGLTVGFDGAGSLTEVAHIDTKSSAIIQKPASMSWSEAASLPLVWLTAYTSIEKCKPFMPEDASAEKRLVVLGGSSSTGIYAVWLAKQRGWKVLTSCSGRNTDFVRERGASSVVDYTSSPDAVKSAVAEFKPHAIIDCVGGTECIGLAPQYVTIVGDKTSRASMGGSLAYFTHPRMIFRWVLGYLGIGNSYEAIILDLNKEWLEKVRELDGSDIIIDSIFKFDQGMAAFERLNTGRARGKVVVTIED